MNKVSTEVLMANDRTNTLCVLQVLKDYTDADHILPLSEIQRHLKLEYDKDLDRRTLYAAFRALNDFGIEVSRYEDNGKGYYLLEREFSAAEARLLIDAIYSCEYISKRQTEELISKLRAQLSVYDRKKYNYSNIIVGERKSPNPQVFLNIEILDQAIDEKKKVSFIYLDYGYDKKLHPRREERYVASPYSMICDSERYYLVMIADGHEDPSFYRIDMMKDIKILDENIEYTKREAKLDSLSRVVFAHTGQQKRVSLRCSKKVLRYVIEQFGSDISIRENQDGSFDASVLTATEGLVYWALQYLQDVEVLSPPEVREEIIKAIKDNPYGV
jgi:predicted DNA-binding transcriptional regulator YafY